MVKALNTPERLTAGNVNKDLSRVIAFCLSDGTVSRRNASKSGQSFTIMFFNKDESLHELFCDSFENAFKIRPKRLPAKRSSCSIIHSKEITLSLMKICNSFRTKACNSSPICPVWLGKTKEGSCLKCIPSLVRGKPFPTIFLGWLDKLDKRCAIEFFRVLFSCDGGVSIWVTKGKFRREVMLGCVNPILAKKLKEKLEELLGTKVGVKDKGIRLTNLKAIRLFREKIGFVKGCKAKRGKFKGIEKNLLLNHAISGTLPAGR